MPTFLMLMLMFVSVLLILVILLQRGRGGGLVGALSGLGGQSAFGTKAGDMFTRITIAIAAVWVLLAGISGQVLRARTDKAKEFGDAIVAPVSGKKEPGMDSTKPLDSEPFDPKVGNLLENSSDPKSDKTTEPATDAKSETKPESDSGDTKKPETKSDSDSDEKKPDAKSDDAAKKSSESDSK